MVEVVSFFLTTGEWSRPNNQTICYEAKNAKPGIFHPLFEGFLAAVKLVHINGTVAIVCGSPVNPHSSFWGCHLFLGVVNTPLNVFVTDKENVILFPKVGAW